LRFAHSLDAELVYSFPGYIQPDVYILPQVLAVPDIQHEFCPEFFSKQALAERKRLYGESIERADHICAISEFTRQTLIDRLGVHPDKITTIHPAADPIFQAENRCKLDAEATLRKYCLERGSYLLFPANTWHHKNHRAAVVALKILRDKYNLSPILVCTGSPREAQVSLNEMIQKLGLDRWVGFLGYCPLEDMPPLYEGAACLLFPSLFEGFGFPVLEAMSCGCPVVCSNATSLPEIAGDAAILIDPHSPEGIADAVYDVLTDEDFRRYLVDKGYRQATQFSWQQYVLETIAIFRKVRQKLRSF